jgi:flagellin FlaB
MKRIKDFLRRVREERGITGLETAIVLIAFVVVAAVFAFVVLSTGLFASERSKETVYAGLSKTRGTMELTGGVVATSNAATVTPATKLITLTFDVTLAAGGDSVNLNPSSTSNRTVIRYNDGAVKIDSLAYTTTVITGNTDKLLEAGEMFEVSIDLTLQSTIIIAENKTFTLEVQPPTGSYMVIQRTTPASIGATVINLN